FDDRNRPAKTKLQAVVVGFVVDLGVADRHAELQAMAGEPVELEGVGDRQVKGGYIHSAHGLRAGAGGQVPLVVDGLLVGAGDRSVGQAVDSTDHGGHQAVGVASYRVEAGLAYGRLVDFGKDFPTILVDHDEVVLQVVEGIMAIKFLINIQSITFEGDDFFPVAIGGIDKL